MSDEVNVKEYVEKFGWSDNPFTFRIHPDLMVGYEEESENLLYAVNSHNKVSLVSGETGAGKTTLLKWLQQQTDIDTFFVPKPPREPDRFLDYLRSEILQPGLFDRLFRQYNRYNIHEALQQKLDQPTLLVIDEGHETTTEVLEWIRTLTDTVDNLIVVLAGLPSLMDTLQREVHTLFNRATALIQLESLNRDNTLELIRRRINHVGGANFEPFTQDALLAVYELGSGFPRETLRICNLLLQDATRQNKYVIERQDVEENTAVQELQQAEEEPVEETVVTQQEEPAETEAVEPSQTPDVPQSTEVDVSEEATGDASAPQNILLTDKQKRILRVIEDDTRATAPEIVEALGVENYKSRDHAVRSVNNILRRLMEEGILERERRGRTYEYLIRDMVAAEVAAELQD